MFSFCQNIHKLRTGIWQTWKKTIFFTQARLDPKLFYQKKYVNIDKSELATKQDWHTSIEARIM